MYPSTHGYQGAAGYLATHSTADESAFVARVLDTIAWIGASDNVGEVNSATGTATFASQAAANGHWYGVAGPESGTNFSNGLVTPATVADQFANWAAGEPNNDGGAEHFPRDAH